MWQSVWSTFAGGITRTILLDDGLLDPDLEKTMAKPTAGASFRG